MVMPRRSRRSARAIWYSQITTILQDIEQSALPPDLKRWSINCLSGHQSSVLFRGHNSKLRRIKLGIAQGCVLFPLLFNLETIPATSPVSSLQGTEAKEYRLDPNISVYGVKIPNVNNPKIVCITFDSLYSFTPHTQHQCVCLDADSVLWEHCIPHNNEISLHLPSIT